MVESNMLLSTFDAIKKDNRSNVSSSAEENYRQEDVLEVSNRFGLFCVWTLQCEKTSNSDDDEDQYIWYNTLF